MAAKAMAKYYRDHKDFVPTLKQTTQELVDLAYRPVRTYLDNVAYTTAEDVNPNYIKPAGLTLRLMKAALPSRGACWMPPGCRCA